MLVSVPQQPLTYSGEDRRNESCGYHTAKMEGFEKSVDDMGEKISKLDSKIDKLGDSFDNKLEKMSNSFDEKIDKMIASIDARLNEVVDSVHRKLDKETMKGVVKTEELTKKFAKWQWIAAIVFTIAGIVLGALGIKLYPFLQIFLR